MSNNENRLYRIIYEMRVGAGAGEHIQMEELPEFMEKLADENTRLTAQLEVAKEALGAIHTGDLTNAMIIRKALKQINKMEEK